MCGLRLLLARRTRLCHPRLWPDEHPVARGLAQALPGRPSSGRSGHHVKEHLVGCPETSRGAPCARRWGASCQDSRGPSINAFSEVEQSRLAQDPAGVVCDSRGWPSADEDPGWPPQKVDDPARPIVAAGCFRVGEDVVDVSWRGNIVSEGDASPAAGVVHRSVDSELARPQRATIMPPAWKNTMSPSGDLGFAPHTDGGRDRKRTRPEERCECQSLLR